MPNTALTIHVAGKVPGKMWTVFPLSALRCAMFGVKHAKPIATSNPMIAFNPSNVTCMFAISLVMACFREVWWCGRLLADDYKFWKQNDALVGAVFDAVVFDLCFNPLACQFQNSFVGFFATEKSVGCGGHGPGFLCVVVVLPVL